MGMAMFTVLGGHWAVFQAVAWSQMLVSYSQDARSVSVGIEKTFSGKYPCAMCRKIAEAKYQQEQKQPVFKADRKAEVFVAQPGTAVSAPASEKFFYPATADSHFTSRSDPPPTPVPIVA